MKAIHSKYHCPIFKFRCFTRLAHYRDLHVRTWARLPAIPEQFSFRPQLLHLCSPGKARVRPLMEGFQKCGGTINGHLRYYKYPVDRLPLNRDR